MNALKLTKQITIGFTALIATLGMTVFAVGAQAISEEISTDPGTSIRVGLFYGTTARDTYTISADAGFTVTVNEYAEEGVHIDVNTLVLSAKNGMLHASTAFGGEIAAAGSGNTVRIVPHNQSQIITIGDKSYRGYIECTADSENHITLVNVLDIEEYLRGVLPSEVYTSWNMEALKASAVTARTYALRSAEGSSHAANGFDVCSTTHCQMYSGTIKENVNTDRAILETTGLVVKYNGGLALTPYHSSNGGYTEEASSAWGGNKTLYPYLTSVFTPYEDYRNVPNGKWENFVKKEELFHYIPESYSSKLNGGIRDIVFNRSATGYNKSMTVTDGSGSVHTYPTSGTVRSFFGKLVKSANFGIGDTYLPSDTVTPAITVISASGTYDMTALQGYTYLTADGEKSCAGFEEILVFDGQGYGHGVGLSQFGSRCMADAGFTYEEILALYFPDTVIESYILQQ